MTIEDAQNELNNLLEKMPPNDRAKMNVYMQNLIKIAQDDTLNYEEKATLMREEKAKQNEILKNGNKAT